MTVRASLVFAALISIFALAAATLAPTQAAEKPSAAAQAGAVLFREKGCSFCHGEAGAGTDKAPSLSSLNSSKEWTPARITNQILKGGQKMPPFSDALTDDEIAQLVAYLKAKNRPAPPSAH